MSLMIPGLDGLRAIALLLVFNLHADHLQIDPHGLYVYHFPIIWFVAQTTESHFKDPYLKPLNALITFAATVVIASLSHHLMDRLILNLNDQFFSDRKPKGQGKTLSILVDT